MNNEYLVIKPLSMCLYCWVTLINTVLKRLFSVNLFFTGIKISSVPFLMDISSSFYPASVIIKFWPSDTLRALWTIAILFNPKLDVRIENVIADKEGRYILLEVSLYLSMQFLLIIKNKRSYYGTLIVPQKVFNLVLFGVKRWGWETRQHYNRTLNLNFN